ncbi:MAG: diol dehydratase small subunit [Propionibacteriaceae bacterium]|jgi:propanediol dehydratase small subunit|uniref:Dehydratase small subunit n=1 Tax=Propionibacterium ruminifibrarum TaxID=1962131 RepID=A0A375I0A1_9ACTN|nr:diol dehydratase small subunit [Propionibacterium ruminifibrarum]MBE6477460.1 diol dehydratase small subunit [Propionibacteriaceae bacterium]SPF67497.1 Dehydratase small subunit [Propionibacterium ruminifibrarum]
MDSEELIRQIMSEVMANLNQDNVTFAKKDTAAPAAAPSPSPARADRVDKSQYPLGEKAPEKIKAANGRPLTDFSFEKLKNGELKAEDFRIAPETLELQAQVAESDGRDSLARNMRRAAELIAVPDDELLEVYDALRPYRSTKAELYAIADKLEKDYGCTINAAFIREGADVYEKRGRLKDSE